MVGHDGNTGNAVVTAFKYVAANDVGNAYSIGIRNRTNAITVTNDTKVGIFQTAPTYTLDVAGGLSVTGASCTSFLCQNNNVNQTVPKLVWTVVKFAATKASYGNVGLTYTSATGTWQNTSGVTVTVRVDYIVDWVPVTGVSTMTYLCQNDDTYFRYGQDIVSQSVSNVNKGSATLLLAANDTFQVLAYHGHSADMTLAYSASNASKSVITITN